VSPPLTAVLALTLTVCLQHQRGWRHWPDRQTTQTRGTMARMTTRVVAAVALTLAALSVPTTAEAKQPPPKCKVLSQTQHLETFGTPGEKTAVFVVTTTTSRCRGKIVITRAATRWLPGPR